MAFDPELARQVASEYCEETGSELGLVGSFVGVCEFLSEYPESLSWRGSTRPGTATRSDFDLLAARYFASYRRPNLPATPGTVPDEMVSVVMEEVYGYSPEECVRIKIDHQHSMSSENCVGAILERYLDSVLRVQGWHWCCGDLVRAIDFIKQKSDGTWILLQVKNRDNSENSSSSAIRSGTPIQKWFRSCSRTGKTNWVNLPEVMRGFGLTEQGFIDFVRSYIVSEGRT